jgi:hypothetical protein
VDDRDPPGAASARLADPEADLDPVVVRPHAERRAGVASALARDAHIVVATATSTVVVSARVGGAGGECEQDEHEKNETCHNASVR